jgi:hypothetical protein
MFVKLKSQKTSYYYCRISEFYTFFMIFVLNKQENKTKMIQFVQEITDDLVIRKVFDLFNANLK